MQHRALIGVLAAALACAAVGGGVALAAVPSSTTGAFTACVNNNSGAVRLIDYQAGDRCTSAEHTVNWSKGYRYRGAWSSHTAYGVLDVVTSGGSSYLGLAASANRPPASSPSYWGLLAAKGAVGAPGPAGVVRAFQTGPGGNTTFPADNTFHTLATLTIPASAAGKYVVNVATALYNNSTTVDDYGNCHVASSAGSSASFLWTSPSTPSGFGSAYPSGSVALTVPAAGDTLTFVCVAAISTGVLSPSMSAVQVTSLVTQ